jgi:hypothetical protein
MPGEIVGKPKEESLKKSASASQLSASRPEAMVEAGGSGSQISALPPLTKCASESQVSALPPASVLSAVAPSALSSAIVTNLSGVSSWPGVPKEIVARARAQDARVEKAMREIRRYHCYGDRGREQHYPNGETDATAFQNAFTKATGGIPLHKWDPRA